jgi:hypothetical protein
MLQTSFCPFLRQTSGLLFPIVYGGKINCRCMVFSRISKDILRKWGTVKQNVLSDMTKEQDLWMRPVL